jgi:hypothetical protein
MEDFTRSSEKFRVAKLAVDMVYCIRHMVYCIRHDSLIHSTFATGFRSLQILVRYERTVKLTSPLHMVKLSVEIARSVDLVQAYLAS